MEMVVVAVAGAAAAAEGLEVVVSGAGGAAVRVAWVVMLLLVTSIVTCQTDRWDTRYEECPTISCRHGSVVHSYHTPCHAAMSPCNAR